MTAQPLAWTVDNPAWAHAAPALSVLIPFLRDDPSPLLAALSAQAARLGGRVEVVARPVHASSGEVGPRRPGPGLRSGPWWPTWPRRVPGRPQVP